MKDNEFCLKELCLEVTSTCPLNCLHCSGNCGTNMSTMLSFDQIKEIVLDFSSLGGTFLEISGGEPFSHPSLIQIVEFATANKLQTILYTSGNIWHADSLTPLSVNFAKDLRKAGLSKVVFSLQGAFSGTHDALTGVQGSYNNVLLSIENMKSVGLLVGVHFVPTKINYKEFANLHQLCKTLGIEGLGVLRFVAQGRGNINKKDLELSTTELFEFNSILRLEIDTNNNTIIRVGRPFDFRFRSDPKLKKKECDAGVSRCLIAPDGRVLPCPAFKQSKAKWTIMGNIKDETLAEIWLNSQKWREIRDFDYRCIEQPCGSCENLRMCKGGCKAQRLLKYDSIYGAPDPFCCECSTPVPMRVLPPSNVVSPKRLLQSQG